VIEMEDRPIRRVVLKDDREVLEEVQAAEQGRFSVGEPGLQANHRTPELRTGRQHRDDLARDGVSRRPRRKFAASRAAGAFRRLDKIGGGIKTEGGGDGSRQQRPVCPAIDQPDCGRCVRPAAEPDRQEGSCFWILGG
jgi:hypothetical protein